MKVLIIEDTIVNFNDDKGGQHQGIGAMPDVTKQCAAALTQAGRALYLDPADDPNKDRRYTASKEMVAAAKAAAKAADEGK